MAAALLVGGSAMAAPHGRAPEPRASLMQGAADYDLRDIAERPERAMGRRAGVQGVVTNVFSSRLFVIRGTGDFSSFRLPIVTKRPLRAEMGRPALRPIQVNDTVFVEGDVLHFTRDAVESRTGGQFTTHAFDRYMDRPMIAADTVTIDMPRPASGAVNFHRRQTGPDITYSFSHARLSDMIGQRARLARVRVLQVISDRGFWVGTSANHRMFVVLDRALDSGVMEEVVNVRKGQIVNLSGVIEEMPTRKEALRRWTIDEEEADQLMDEPAYLHIDGISVLDQ